MKRIVILMILLTMALNSWAVNIEVRDDIPPGLRSRIEKLYPKVCDVLGMYPDSFPVNVLLFKNNKELAMALDGFLFHEGAYDYRNNTLYFSASNVGDEVLIHELAHAVCYRYAGDKISLKSQEILAGYCQHTLTKGATDGSKK
jgi:hypothetical protein